LAGAVRVRCCSRWSVAQSRRGVDADLAVYLDAALRALAAGFHDDVLVAEPEARPRP
jgi:hypothetical protein